MSLLASIPLFRGLTAHEIAALDAIVEEHQVAANTVLFEQGDIADAVYVIAEGSVRIVQDGNDLATLQAGDFFGEMGVIDRAPRCAAAITDEVSRFLFIKKDDFLHLMALNPHLSRTVTSAISARLSAALSPERGGGTIVGVFSSTGGVGTSMFTANLATALHDLGQGRVLVVDLDLMFGDQGQIFKVESPVTMADLIGQDELTAEVISRCVVESESGVFLLQAPKLPEHAEIMQPGTIISCLELLRHHFDYIVCDTPHVIQEFNLNLLELVQIPLYLMTPEVLSVKNAAKWFSVMKRISFPIELVHLVFNKYEPKDHGSLELIEDNLSCRAFGSIPYDYGNAKESLNHGKLIVREAPQSPVGNGIRQVAGKLTGVNVPPPPEVPFWRRWVRV